MSYRAVHVGAELTGKRELPKTALSLLRLQPAAHKHCCWSPHKLRSVTRTHKASFKMNALQIQTMLRDEIN